MESVDSGKVKSMKILHISSGAPLDYRGGIQNYVRTLAKAQHEKGDEVYVLGESSKEEYDFKLFSCNPGCKVVRLGMLKDPEQLRLLKDFFEKNRFDLIHIHMMMNIDWDICSILKDYRYIVSLHDYFFICPRVNMMKPDQSLCRKRNGEQCRKCVSYWEQAAVLRKPYNLARQLLKKPFLKAPYLPQKITDIRYEKSKELLENASLLIPVSKRVEAIFRDSGINGRYETLYIGNTSAYSFKEEKPIGGKSNRKIIVAMIGSFVFIKGAKQFIKIAKKLDGDKYELHFWGNCQEYEAQMRDAGIRNHGKYDPDDLEKILSAIDIGCILPVWEDNAPQVVMELLNNRVPVVATKMGGIPEFINENNGYLYDPYSEESFGKLLDFFEDLTPERIQEMSRNIQRTLTPDEHLEQLQTVYKKVLANHL